MLHPVALRVLYPLYSAGTETPETDNAMAAAAKDYATTFTIRPGCSEDEE
jgi:hypothetical protein